MQYFARAESVVRWSVFLLFLLAPFFFIPVPWVSVVQAKMLLSVVVITVCFLAWIAMSLKDSEIRIPRSWLLIAALSIPLAYLISALVSGPSWSSLIGEGGGQDTVVGFVIWYVALFLSAVILGAQANRPALAVRLLMLSTAVIIVVQAMRLLLPAFTFGGVLSLPATSVVGSWHDLGIYLSLALFLSLALLSTSVFEGAWRYVALAALVGAAVLLVVVNYSDVWLALAGVSLLYALFRFRMPPAGARFGGYKLSLLWLLIALLAGAMYFVGPALQRALPASLQITQVEVRPSWKGTFAIGREVFAEPTQILFGSGPNTFPREWGRYKPLSVNTTQFWNTDFYYGVGFIPTSLVTTGILGLIAWIAMCGALLIRVVRLFRESSSASLLRAALVFSAVFLTVYHILYVPGPALSLLTFLLFGAVVAEEVLTGSISRSVISVSWDLWKGRAAALALSLAGLVLFFGGVQSTRALVSDVLVNRAIVQYQSSQDIGKASRSIALSIIVLPGSDRANRAGVELGILQLAALASSSDGSSGAQAELQGTLNATIQHGLAAVAIDSRNYQNWLTLARLYGELAGAGVTGAEEAAREAYKEAASASPTNPLSYLGLAQLDIVKGDDASARKNLETAIGIKPDLAAAHFLLSQIFARANALPDAKQHAETVVQIAPQDALGWYNHGTVMYALQDYENAVLSFEHAVSIESNYANALFLLGLSYYRLDRSDDALRVLRAVAATNPDDAALRDTIEDIEAGRDPFAPSAR
ncbi:tetratricopeptide repeat protein [Candidatus Kaiserbacteria bacterium]|nr:tetratricopeptide repeat protein [Candidatus Kaiserbacteria bacterium]